jgi:hypothetical protein
MIAMMTNISRSVKPGLLALFITVNRFPDKVG